MSSPVSSTLADVRLRPSGRAMRLLFAAHAGPLLLVAVAMPASAWMFVVAAAFALSWLWLRRHPAIGHGPRALAHLLAHGDGRWHIADAAGRNADAELLDCSVATGRIMCLNFRLPNGRRRSRLLLGDEADEESMRRLRVAVRSRHGPASAGDLAP